MLFLINPDKLINIYYFCSQIHFDFYGVAYLSNFNRVATESSILQGYVKLMMESERGYFYIWKAVLTYIQYCLQL